MNIRGGIDNAVTGLIGLFVALIVLWVVMIIWQPITTLHLYPLLNNAEAFAYGGSAVVLLEAMVLVAVAAILLAFFSEVRGERRPPSGAFG